MLEVLLRDPELILAFDDGVVQHCEWLLDRWGSWGVYACLDVTPAINKLGNR